MRRAYGIALQYFWSLDIWAQHRNASAYYTPHNRDDATKDRYSIGDIFQWLCLRAAALRFESGSIERQGRGVKKCNEFLRPLFGRFPLLALVFSVGEGDEIECGRAEKKFVPGLFDDHFLALQRRSIPLQNLERYLGHPLIWDVAVHVVLLFRQHDLLPGTVRQDGCSKSNCCLNAMIGFRIQLDSQASIHQPEWTPYPRLVR